MKLFKKLILSIMLVLFSLIISVNIIPELQNSYIVEAASVKINKTKKTLYVGQTYTLKIKGTNKKVKWSSSNTKIATVNSKGKVTAKKKGTVTITAKVSGKKYKCKITIEDPKINNKKYIMSVGEKYKVKVSGTSQKIKWTSDNKKIVKVDSKGNIKALNVGSTKITATVGDKILTCKVYVENPELDKRYVELELGSEQYLYLKNTIREKKWESSNASIVKVDEDGYIEAVGIGNAIISAKVGNSTYKCNVKVKDLKINHTSEIMYLNEELYLNIRNLSNSYYYGEVKWYSLNDSIAKVDKYGEVIAVGVGNTKICAKVANKIYSCDITVKSLKDKISVSYQKTNKGVVALLTNNNDCTIEVDANMIFYDKNNRIIANDSDEEYSFEPYTTIAMYFESYDTNIYDYIDFNKYKLNFVNLERKKYSKSYVKNISISASKTNDKLVVCAKNNSGTKLEFVKIAVVFYDENNNCIDYTYHYADCSTNGSSDYIDFYYPDDEDYNTIIPTSYKIFINSAY